MVCKLFFSGIRTTFEANTIPYHNEDIPGYILRYGVPFCPWVALIHIFYPSLPIAYTGFQVGPTFPIFPTFPYFFDLLLLFPTFS